MCTDVLWLGVKGVPVQLRIASSPSSLVLDGDPEGPYGSVPETFTWEQCQEQGSQKEVQEAP